jgi:glycosyltransferase involved in cell wall biosynthesis
LKGKDEEDSFIEMDRLIRKELKDLGLKRTLIFTSQQLQQLRQYVVKRNLKNFYSLIDLKGFSKIRNTGLLLAQAISSDVAIFIDNDEVVEDPDYIKIACEYINQRWRGKIVCGKGGFYVNADGNILLPSSRLWWRLLWNKAKWMNRVWQKILSSRHRLVPSPVLLGGNLVLHRYLFRSVPFDPYIPRGEDTDYLINARQFGFSIFFDKQLRITHLHPERKEEYFYDELKWDIERFLYEREKIKHASDLDLNPYPGCFLNRTLYPKAVLTSLFLGLDYFVRGEWKKAAGCIGNIHLILQKRDGGWLRYLKFKEDWERVMAEIQREGMDGILERCWM